MSANLSFLGDPAVKEKHIKQLQYHHDMDEIVQGQYWENGKGCDTGCTFHDNDFTRWETELGIPIQIGYLRERIFESLPNDKAKEFPLAVSKATPVGVDLTKVWQQAIVWVLVDEKYGVINVTEDTDLKKVIQDVADAYADLIAGKEVTPERWAKIGGAAWAARAAWAAWEAWEAWEAWAARAAWAAWEAWEAWEARAAWAAWEAWEAWEARAKEIFDTYYIALSEKLIQLLQDAK